jgi:hypothetical protein
LSRAEVVFEFPGRYLHSHDVNTISLSAVGTAAKNVPDAGFSYDAIELESAPEPKFDQREATAKVMPTIFYKEDGGLKEVVNMRIC